MYSYPLYSAISSNHLVIMIIHFLASQASLEVCTGTFLEQLYNLNVPSVTKALRCQKAEHTFAGMPCGIMDQYVSAMGAEGKLLLIDCRTNEAKLIPFGSSEQDASQYRLVVTNSNVKHKLSDSEYPLRVQQCREAVAAVQKTRPDAEVTALRDVDISLLNSCDGDMSAVAYQRARHCVREDARTLGAVRSLAESDFATVGRLMTESHASLRDDFEVSSTIYISCVHALFIISNLVYYLLGELPRVG
jgi:galactokinase